MELACRKNIQKRIKNVSYEHFQVLRAVAPLKVGTNVMMQACSFKSVRMIVHSGAAMILFTSIVAKWV